MTNARGYCRFSPRPDADDSLSNAKQADRIRDYCKAKGYALKEPIFMDDDISGGLRGKDTVEGTLEKQKALWDCLEAMRKGDVLVVRWRSRLARDTMARDWIGRTLAKKGCRIEATDEANGEEPQDKLVQGIISCIDAYQRDMIRIMTARAMQKHQASGRRMGRKDLIPWGWMLDPADDKRMLPCQEEIEIAEKIVLMRQAGGSYYCISKVLDGTNRRGKKFWDEGFVRKLYHKWTEENR